ncbi:hypothetical protein A2U01_0081176, partial [Trifolium medium]|nr:hypothetical protein [Trifolium medium]
IKVLVDDSNAVRYYGRMGEEMESPPQLNKSVVLQHLPKMISHCKEGET